MSPIAWLFDRTGFVPRAECGDWSSSLITLHVGSDVLIWMAYVSVPIILIYFARQRGLRGVPGYNRLIWLFAGFILACGTTHLVDAIIFRYPVYHFFGVMKALTAVVSWATVLSLIPAVPRLLELVGRLESSGNLLDEPEAQAADQNNRLRAYILAVLSAVLALLVRVFFSEWLLADHAFVIPLLAVVAMSWYGGFGPGMVTLLLSLVGYSYFFMDPSFSFRVVQPTDHFAIALFLFTGICCALLGEAQRQSRIRADHHLRNLAFENKRREKAEEELRQYANDLTAAQRKTTETLALLDTFVKHAPVGLAFFDHELRSMLINRYLAEGTDKPNAAHLGQAVEDVLPSFPKDAVEDIRRVAEEGVPVINRTIMGPDPESPDEVAVWEASFYPVRDSDGRTLGVGVVAENITDRREAENALRESEDRFRTMADSAPVLIWVAGLDKGCTYFNRAWLDFTGRTMDDELGHAWMVGVHPDDLDHCWMTYSKSFDARQAFEVEYRLRRHDGEYRWLFDRGIPRFAPNGEFRGYIGSCIDVTDRRRAEEALREEQTRFRLAAEATGVGIWDNNPITGTLLWDHRVRQQFGVSSDQPVTMETFYAGLHPADREYVRQAVLRAFEPNGSGEFDAEYRVVGIEDRVERWISARGQVLFSPLGEPIRFTGSTLDISDRKAILEAVRESEEKFRAMADSIPQLAWMARPDGHIFWYNRRWLEFTGKTLAEMEGWGWEQLHDPEYLPKVVERWTHSITHGEPFEMVFPLRGADGRYRMFLTRIVPTKDEQGQVVRWFGTNTDVTEQRELVATLRASEARFRSLSEAVPQLIWVTDPAGGNEYVNSQWFTYTGLSCAESQGLTWIKIVHADDLQRTQERWEKALATGNLYENEYRLRRHDGEYRWFLARAVPQKDDQGQIIRWFGTCTDIQDWKIAIEAVERSEARFRSLAEAIPNIVWTARPDGNRNYFNRQWYDYTGAGERDSIGMAWTSAVHPDDRAGLLNIWHRAISSGQSLEAEYRLLRHDGVYRWHLTRGIAVKDPTDQITQWVGTVTDVEDQKQYTERLEQQVRERTVELSDAIAELKRENQVRQKAEEMAEAVSAELRRSNEELEKFAYVASHDLQEPLRKIQAFGDRLRQKYQGTLGEQGNDYLARVMTSASRMRELINDLLAFSRITTKGQPFTVVDLNLILQGVLSDLEERVRQTGGTVHADRLPILDADPMQMRQLLQNLIGNALKFHQPDQPPVVQITAQVVERNEGGPICRLEVCDNGIGFDEKYLDRIFQVFQRLHGRSEYEGTGVGLAICRKIVERHNGDITARSQPGVGATFVVTLPIRQPYTTQTSTQ